MKRRILRTWGERNYKIRNEKRREREKKKR